MGKYNKLELEGMDKLLDKLKKMNNTPQKVSKQALNKAGEYVRRVQVEVAESTHNKYSEDVGAKELKKFGVKTRKTGSQYIDIGLRGSLTASQKKKDSANTKAGKSRPTYWDKVKGLYFNNFGFYHNRTGEYITGTDWMGDAYDESSKEAYRIIKEEIVKGLEL